MFVAHLPAGYLMASYRYKQQKPLRNLVFWGMLIGSVFPDLDLFYFYLIDNRARPHHEYFTHIPFYWGLLLIAAYWLRKYAIFRSVGDVAWGMGWGGLLHICLDTAVGGIYWLSPFNDALIRYSVVPARYSCWILNFILHWYFIVELCLVAWAGFRFWQMGRRGKI